MKRKNPTIGSIAFAITMISIIPTTRSHAASTTDEREAIRPYNINIPEEALTDLRQRIKATRWPDKETVSDQSQGAQLATVQKLARRNSEALDDHPIAAIVERSPR